MSYSIAGDKRDKWEFVLLNFDYTNCRPNDNPSQSQSHHMMSNGV